MKKYVVQHEMDDETTIVTCDDDENNDITFGVGIPWQVRLHLARHLSEILNAMETGERVKLPLHMMRLAYFNKDELVDTVALEKMALYYGKHVDKYDVIAAEWKPPIMVKK